MDILNSKGIYAAPSNPSLEEKNVVDSVAKEV